MTGHSLSRVRLPQPSQDLRQLRFSGANTQYVFDGSDEKTVDAVRAIQPPAGRRRDPRSRGKTPPVSDQHFKSAHER